jgi:hypothetical protein
VRAEEGPQSAGVALADFAEHPTGRFVDEVVLVIEQKFGNRKRVDE